MLMGAPYEWLTFADAREQAETLFIGIRDLKLCPVQTIEDSGIEQTDWRMMGIYSENRFEYAIM